LEDFQGFGRQLKGEEGYSFLIFLQIQLSDTRSGLRLLEECLPLSVITSFTGLVLYSAYYNCDPIVSKKIASQDQLLPFYVMDMLSKFHGLPGLFVSGIFSGALSTVSSAVNSLAAVTVEDFIKPCMSSRRSDRYYTSLSKVLVLTYGLICVALTFVAEQLGGVLQATFTIFGVIGGPLLGLFSLGMFTTRANKWGALTGLWLGLAVSFIVGFGASIVGVKNPTLPRDTYGCNITAAANNTVAPVIDYMDVTSFENETNINKLAFLTSELSTHTELNAHIFYLYRLSYMWLTPLGFFITMLTGYLVSLITGCNKEDIRPCLISPPFVKLYWSKHKLRCIKNNEDTLFGAVDEGEREEMYSVEPSNPSYLNGCDVYRSSLKNT